MSKKNILYIVLLLMIGIGIFAFNSKKSISYSYEIPTNEFSDENFYKCIIDSYNLERNENLTYSDLITDDELESITSLTCIGTSDSDKIQNVVGIEKLLNLTTLNLKNNNISSMDLNYNRKLVNLNLSNNKLTKLDLSKHNKLQELIIKDNPFKIEKKIYKGTILDVDTSLQLPSQIEMMNLSWITSDENIAIVNTNGVIKTKTSGEVEIIGESNQYTMTMVLDVIDNSNVSLNTDNIYLIKSGKNVLDIKNKLGNDIVVKLDNSVKEDMDEIGTGFKIEKGNTIITTVVLGDVNGDAKINITDIILLKRHILNIANLQEEYFFAGDLELNNDIDATDYLRMKQHMLGISKL